MTGNKDPPKEPITPSRYPERDVVGEYRKMYRQLQGEGYKRMEAIRKISEAFGGVSLSTVRYYVPSTLAQFDQKNWESQRQRDSRQTYNTKRRAAARHLDDHIREIYASADQDELTIQELSDALAESTGFKFLPATILRYDKKHAERYGQSLLERISRSGRELLYRLYHQG